jgi:hypothetical protein
LRNCISVGRWGGGFVGIENVENEILKAAVSQTKSIVLTRYRNKAAKFA